MFSSCIRFCFFLRRDHDPETSSSAVHRACYNQLATTLQRYRAQQQQATPCACGRSALYCVELLWKAPEIHHPSHLLVSGISRLLLSLFCFVRHKNQIQHTTLAPVQRARYSQRPCRAQQQQATPCVCGRYALYAVALLSNLRSVNHHIYLCWSYILQQLNARGFVPARR